MTGENENRPDEAGGPSDGQAGPESDSASSPNQMPLEHQDDDASQASNGDGDPGSTHVAEATEAFEIPHDLPQPAVGRLSLYYRELMRLLDADGVSLNSQELGRIVDVSPAVVRRDLSALGTIGRRGVGYDIRTLVDRIGSVLGSGVQWKVVLVGVGSLGDALLRYRGFERLGFRLSAAFDNDPSRIGTKIGGVEILDADQIESVLAEEPAELAILAVPAEHAGEIAARLIASRISGILNFAPTTLRLSGSVAVVNVDLASELQRLAFAVQTQK